MGGIVGAEALLLLASEQPLPPPSKLPMSSENMENLNNCNDPQSEDAPLGRSTVSMDAYHLMFPHIQGLLAFDTPFLGIAPGVISHGAEEHYKTASTAYTAISEVAGLFGYGSSSKNDSTTIPGSTGKKSSTPLALPASTTDAAATPSWQRLGRYAMFAGAAGAVAAGGAAALYSQKDRFTAGWGWMSSHLEFVGCLARPVDLRKRVESLGQLRQERGINSINLYTCLGKAATPVSANPLTDDTSTKNRSSSLIFRIPRSTQRTFCHLPEDYDPNETAVNTGSGLQWVKAVNDKAPNETTAHVSMFLPRDNPAYYNLAHDAAETLVSWIDQSWYDSATCQFSSTRPDESFREQPQPQPQPQPQSPVDMQQSSKQRVPTAEELKRSEDASSQEFMEADDVVIVD